jgi:hypothetical protein
MSTQSGSFQDGEHVTYTQRVAHRNLNFFKNLQQGKKVGQTLEGLRSIGQKPAGKNRKNRTLKLLP